MYRTRETNIGTQRVAYGLCDVIHPSFVWDTSVYLRSGWSGPVMRRMQRL